MTMPVLVRNETTSPWIFERSAGSRQLAPGAVQLISDDEWTSIISAKRGAGQINALWPAQTDLTTVELDYYTVNSLTEARYVGVSPLGSLKTDSVWTVKRMSHASLTGGNFVTEVQSLSGVAWGTTTADRDALAWT
jgi:hypothetical protein